MIIDVVIGNGQPPYEAIVVTAAEGPVFGAKVDDTLASALLLAGCTGAEGEVVKVPAPPGLPASLVVCVGLGSAKDRLGEAAAVAARALAGVDSALFLMPVRGRDDVANVALGARLGAYSYSLTRRASRPVARVAVSVGGEHAQAVHRSAVLADAVNTCRDLVNEPPNRLTPEALVAQARELAAECGLEFHAMDEHALDEAGFGGIVAVGRGSAHPPALVRIAHTHPDARTTLAYVGKGITYDSGGLSLKRSMAEIMKLDMAGAAAVLTAVAAAAWLRLPVNITGWLALAENMPSGAATRPGDVIRMYGGRTVEVVNTDAEGRLVLADAIVRAGEEDPDALVDVATLTGEMMIALGRRTIGLMASDEGWRATVAAAAAAEGEQHWPMPLLEDLRPDLDSSVAGLRNMGEAGAGGISGGLFLREFVPDRLPWAHLDIAGPSFNSGEPYGRTPRGGTGAGVLTLIRLAEDVAGGLRPPSRHEWRF